MKTLMSLISAMFCLSICMGDEMTVKMSSKLIDAKNAVADPCKPLLWYNARDIGIDGQGWKDTQSYYDRLPAGAEAKVRPEVWFLSKHSAGLCVRFATDSTSIWAKWKLRFSDLAMFHMPAQGVSGLDLYIHDGKKWQFVGFGKAEAFPVNECLVAGSLRKEMHEYLLYLPLYNGIDSLELGIDKGATLSKLAYPADRKPIVFYGSSIIQGACASRPGMAFTSIVGRRLNYPVINLGFSGQAKTEPELGDLVSELDASVFVVDSVPNLSNPEVSERIEPFLMKIRTRHPSTPIIVCETICYPNIAYNAYLNGEITEKNLLLRKIYDKLIHNGFTKLYYVNRRDYISDDGDAFVDLIHPTDLGFTHMADALEPILHKNLKN